MRQVTHRDDWISRLGALSPTLRVNDIVLPGIDLKRPVTPQDLEAGLRVFRSDIHLDSNRRVIIDYLEAHSGEVVYLMHQPTLDRSSVGVQMISDIANKSPDERLIEVTDDERMMVTILKPTTFKQMARDIMGIYAKSMLKRADTSNFKILRVPIRSRVLRRNRWKAFLAFTSSYHEVLSKLHCICFDVNPEQCVVDAIIAINFTETST